jgi:hypothetical protein
MCSEPVGVNLIASGEPRKLTQASLSFVVALSNTELDQTMKRLVQTLKKLADSPGIGVLWPNTKWIFYV